MAETNMDRSQFLEWAKKALASDIGELDIVKLARQGAASGILTAEEAAKLEGHCLVPDWLAAGLSGEIEGIQVSNIRPHVVIEAMHHVAPRPAVFGAAQLPMTFQSNKGNSPTVKMFAGNNGKFVVQNFLRAAFVSDGYIPELSIDRNLWASSIFNQRSPRRLNGVSIVAVVEGGSVLSHWLFDTLPKLELVKLLGMPLNRVDNIILVTNHTNFHHASLRAIGVDNSRVRTRRELGPFICCDEFYAVSDLRSGFFAAPWVYEMVRDRFLRGHRPVEPWRKLYISRSKASRRRIVNEMALLPILEKWGFSIVTAEDLSIHETAQLMAEASHVVAPHGAGLSNVVFAHDEAKILEIYGSHLSSEFWKICASRKLPYHLIQGLDANGKPFLEKDLQQAGFFERNGADFMVPVAEFEAAIDHFMRS